MCRETFKRFGSSFINDVGLLLKQKRDSDLEPIPGRNMIRSNYSFTCISENFRNFSGIYRSKLDLLIFIIRHEKRT